MDGRSPYPGRSDPQDDPVDPLFITYPAGFIVLRRLPLRMAGAFDTAWTAYEEIGDLDTAADHVSHAIGEIEGRLMDPRRVVRVIGLATRTDATEAALKLIAARMLAGGAWTRSERAGEWHDDYRPRVPEAQVEAIRAAREAAKAAKEASQWART